MRALYFLLCLIFISPIVFASTKKLAEMPVSPGTQVIGGDANRNEFFVVSDHDVVAIKQSIHTHLKETMSKHNAIAISEEINPQEKSSNNNNDKKSKKKPHKKHTVDVKYVQAKHPHKIRLAVVKKSHRLAKHKQRPRVKSAHHVKKSVVNQKQKKVAHSVKRKPLDVVKPVKFLVAKAGTYQNMTTKKIRCSPKKKHKHLTHKKVHLKLKSKHKNILANSRNTQPIRRNVVVYKIVAR